MRRGRWVQGDSVMQNDLVEAIYQSTKGPYSLDWYKSYPMDFWFNLATELLAAGESGPGYANGHLLCCCLVTLALHGDDIEGAKDIIIFLRSLNGDSFTCERLELEIQRYKDGPPPGYKYV